MHPIITRDLTKAWITDLHRQAKQSTPFYARSHDR
jgi:hypothetical protein